MEGPCLLYFLFVTCCLLLASLLRLFKSMGPPSGGFSLQRPELLQSPRVYTASPGNAVFPGETPWKVSRPPAGHQAAPAVQAGRLGEAQLHNFFFFF